MLLSLRQRLYFSAYKTLGYFNDPFKDLPLKIEWRNKLKSKPLPERRYVIFFTPRSGSSRLTDLLHRAGGLGFPDESFNPRHIREMACFLGAQDLDDYIDLLKRRRTTNGTFGCEIAIDQLNYIFFSDKRFFKLYSPTAIIFLIRENIVEQAVSLSRMAQTGLAHRTTSSDLNSLNVRFKYRPSQIRRKLLTLLNFEMETERLFYSRNIQPLRLSYEMLTCTEPEKFVPIIAGHIGCAPNHVHGLKSVYEKIGDDRNHEYSLRFKKENSRLLDKIAKQRSFTLNKLAEQKATRELNY